MTVYRVVNIRWETGGIHPEALNLPINTRIQIDVDPENLDEHPDLAAEIGEALRKAYGFSALQFAAVPE